MNWNSTTNDHIFEKEESINGIVTCMNRFRFTRFLRYDHTRWRAYMLIFPTAIMMMEDEDDRAFMEKLYLDHRYLLFKIAYDIVKDYQVAEDLSGRQ